MSHPKYVIKLLRKTELCRNYEAHGVCPYGRRCQYAHGPAELRPKPLSEHWQARQPAATQEYKRPGGGRKMRALCLNIIETGECGYGDDCKFIHDGPHMDRYFGQGPDDDEEVAAAAMD